MLNDELCEQVRVNPSWTPFVRFKGELFENGTRYAKSDYTVQKSLKKRIQNHILHVQFKRKISVSQSNLLYPKHGVSVSVCVRWRTRLAVFIQRKYMYIMTIKWQKMPKQVKMLTSKWHRSKNTSLCILLDHFNALGLSRNNIFCHKQWERGGEQF